MRGLFFWSKQERWESWYSELFSTATILCWKRSEEFCFVLVVLHINDSLIFLLRSNDARVQTQFWQASSLWCFEATWTSVQYGSISVSILWKKKDKVICINEFFHIVNFPVFLLLRISDKQSFEIFNFILKNPFYSKKFNKMWPMCMWLKKDMKQFGNLVSVNIRYNTSFSPAEEVRFAFIYLGKLF